MYLIAYVEESEGCDCLVEVPVILRQTSVGGEERGGNGRGGGGGGGRGGDAITLLLVVTDMLLSLYSLSAPLEVHAGGLGYFLHCFILGIYTCTM